MHIIKDLTCCRFNLLKNKPEYLYDNPILHLRKNNKVVIFKNCTIRLFNSQNIPTATLVFIDCSISYLEIEGKINKLILINSELMNISSKKIYYLQINHTIIHILLIDSVKKIKLNNMMVLTKHNIISKRDKKSFYST